jgi:uncharacterized protein
VVVVGPCAQPAGGSVADVAPFEVDAGGDIVLRVHVQPGATRPGVVGRHGDAVKLKVGAAAERGRANAAVVKLLAAELSLRASDVDVLTGHTHRLKRVRLRGVDAAAVSTWLATRGGG